MKTYDDGVLETMEMVGRILRVNYRKDKRIVFTRNQIRDELQRFRDECKEEAKYWKKKYFELKDERKSVTNTEFQRWMCGTGAIEEKND